MATGGVGVEAISMQGIALLAKTQSTAAVYASSKTGPGVEAHSSAKQGVLASSIAGFGVEATSRQGIAVRATSLQDTAVFATSDTGVGIDARSNSNSGLCATSNTNVGIRANSTSDHGILAHSVERNGICGLSDQAIGVYGKGGLYAAAFEGVVMVEGDVQLSGADCAEEFDVADGDGIEPGSVLVIGPEEKLCLSSKAYDKCVAGVVSGAGSYKPGLILAKEPEAKGRLPIALVGRAFCKVDASFAPVDIGDLLTTSDHPGYAMRASDPQQAFGAVIGKALRPLQSGLGLIPVLVALQ